MSSLLEYAEHVVSNLGYPSIFVRAANYLLEDQQLQIADDADVDRNCRLRGRIQIDRGATVSEGSNLFGDVTVGPHASVGSNNTLSGDVSVGKRTNMDPDIEAIGSVDLGKYCALAREILFQQRDHVTSKPGIQMRFYREVLDSSLEHTDTGPITVGNDVWIGARAIVLSGVTIGDGAVIGAGSIVTSDVEPYAVVAGVPAERQSWRFGPEIREKLQEVEWWTLPEKELREYRDFFDSQIESVDDIPEL